MTDELDKNIRYVLDMQYSAACAKDDDFNEIKQAFIDAGWFTSADAELVQQVMDFRVQAKQNCYVIPSELDTHVHVCSGCPQVANTRFMTGQEWYNKFEHELDVINIHSDSIRSLNGAIVKKAAKKAAGLDK